MKGEEQGLKDVFRKSCHDWMSGALRGGVVTGGEGNVMLFRVPHQGMGTSGQ